MESQSQGRKQDGDTGSSSRVGG
jgi:hypothetical protein